MSKSTKQLWHTDAKEVRVYDADGTIVILVVETPADCRCIVADHNGCIGIEEPVTTVPELVAICSELIEALDDAAQYKGDFLRDKHDDEGLLIKARTMLAKTKGQPT